MPASFERMKSWNSVISPESVTPLVLMRLLIIEDDRDAADYIVRAFRETGHVADHAADGEDGLAMALDGEYDVLIVDRMLPKRDGLSVIGTLREKGIETPVLILSALARSTTASRACAPAATIICPSHIPFRNCSPASRRSPVAAADAATKWSIASAISSSTGCRMKCAAARRRSCCSRANSACSNIS
jgi:CheY-like chemotaxis protein